MKKNLKNLTEKSRERKTLFRFCLEYFRFNFLENVAKIRKLWHYQDSRQPSQAFCLGKFPSNLILFCLSVCSIVMLETRWKWPQISSATNTKSRTCTTFCWTSAVSCSPSRPWWRPTGSWHPRSRTAKRPITKMKVNPIVPQTLLID